MRANLRGSFSSYREESGGRSRALGRVELTRANVAAKHASLESSPATPRFSGEAKTYFLAFFFAAFLVDFFAPAFFLAAFFFLATIRPPYKRSDVARFAAPLQRGEVLSKLTCERATPQNKKTIPILGSHSLVHALARCERMNC